MDQSLLLLEKEPGRPDLIQEIFRAAHSVKGGSAYLNLKGINEFTHHLESLLDGIRKGKAAATSEVMDLLFKSTDILKQQIEYYAAHGSEEPRDVAPLIQEIERLSKSNGAVAAAKGAAPPQKPAADSPVTLEDFTNACGQYLAVIEAAVSDLRSGADSQEVYDQLHRAFNGLKIAAALMQFNDVTDLMEQETMLVNELRQGAAKISPSTIERFARVGQVLARYLELKKERGGGAVELAEVLQQLKPAAKAAEPQEPQARKAIRDEPMVRVGERRLDQLMNLIGELIIVRNRFNIINKNIREHEEELNSRDDFTDATSTLSRISNDLQLLIMDVRMMPVSTVFNKFPRMVRDFAKSRGKKIELEMDGEETALDKTVIEKIGDPLVHLVRNAIDHGIEAPEARLAQGKPETGSVRLCARNEGENVIIEIKDDGKGMDPEVLKRKAVEKGLLTQAQADRLEADEAIELIFEPGFSTAEVVTDVSGRGVGMDVVRSNIKKLSGEITIKTAVGKGTVFSIRLPMSLAVMKVLMTGLGSALYAFPLSSVQTTVKVAAQEVSSIGGKGRAIVLHGNTLVVTPLRELLGLPGAEADNGKLSVIVITAGDKRLGVVVDRFYEQQEIVVKPLEGMAASVGISGSAILGDGRIAFVIDGGELLKLALRGAA